MCVRDDLFRILLAASAIPSGSRITKARGDKEYRLVREIKVYGEGGEPRTMAAHGGAVFLMQENGTGNAVDGSTILIWIVTRHTLLNYLDPPPDPK